MIKASWYLSSRSMKKALQWPFQKADSTSDSCVSPEKQSRSFGEGISPMVEQDSWSTAVRYKVCKHLTHCSLVVPHNEQRVIASWGMWPW